jgi:hypothetical protein
MRRDDDARKPAARPVDSLPPTCSRLSVFGGQCVDAVGVLDTQDVGIFYKEDFRLIFYLVWSKARLYQSNPISTVFYGEPKPVRLASSSVVYFWSPS